MTNIYIKKPFKKSFFDIQRGCLFETTSFFVIVLSDCQYFFGAQSKTASFFTFEV